MKRALAAFPLLLLSALSPAALAAPCGTWQPGAGIDGLTGGNVEISAVTNWDRDGAGPQPPVIVVGGTFRNAGGRLVNNIAAWDGSQWHPIGSGFNDIVYDVEGLPNGELLAVGRFTQSGTNPTYSVAKWNGTSWVNFGGDEPVGDVYGIVVFPNGSFMIGGNFERIASIFAHQVAHFYDNAWHPVSTGLDGTVLDLTLAADGSVYASGHLSPVGGPQFTYLARWESPAWRPVPRPNFLAESVPVPTVGAGVIGGGSRSIDLGNGNQQSILAVSTYNGISRTANTSLPVIPGRIRTIEITPDRTFACGQIDAPFTSAAFEIDQSGARHIPGGPNNIDASLIDSSNHLIVAGNFTTNITSSGAVKRANRIMSYDGTS